MKGDGLLPGMARTLLLGSGQRLTIPLGFDTVEIWSISFRSEKRYTYTLVLSTTTTRSLRSFTANTVNKKRSRVRLPSSMYVR